jgi:hypothetical protein
MSSDASQEEKQNFLRQSILAKGYDTNLFVEFLMDKKGEEGADVGNWTMSDLKIVVKEFISLQENSNNNNINKAELSEEINPTNFNKNKSKNSNNPLENNPPINKSHVKYDPLSGGINPNTNEEINNQNSNNQNSSIKNFFVNNNIKNNNPQLNNNINTVNNQNLNNNIYYMNNQNNTNNTNMQMNPQQMQYLQQYLQLLKSQNPQFQNQMIQYGIPNQQQIKTNPQNNFQNTINTNNIPQNNNPQPTKIQQNNISNIPQSQIPTNSPTKIKEDKDKENKEKENEKEESPNKNKVQENQPTSTQETQSDNTQKGVQDPNIDISLAYGIITNPIEDTKFVDKTPLTIEDNPLIQVGFPEKVEGGFFSKSYVTYLITTTPLNLKVRRRYSDFDWLHQMLQNLYLWNVIPTTPRKNRFASDKFSEPFLKKRMRALEKFLNYCLLNPIIKCSQIFFDFISIEKEADFQKKKKEYEKMKPPMYVEDFQTLFGKANIEINNKKVIYYENIKDNISINENLLIKLNENFKMLKTLIENLTVKIDEIAQNWDDLCQNSAKYFDGDDIIKSYEHMNKLFSNWSESLKRHNNIIFIDIREYFKYTKNHFRSMKDLVNCVENYKNTYTKNERYLINKKEDLFKKGDINKWDLNIQDKNKVNDLVKDKNLIIPKILPKETSNVINMKKIYGFYLNRMIEEYERIKAINSDNHKKNLIYACERTIEIYGDFQKGTADIINFFNNNNVKNKVIDSDENEKKD